MLPRSMDGWTINDSTKMRIRTGGGGQRQTTAPGGSMIKVARSVDDETSYDFDADIVVVY